MWLTRRHVIAAAVAATGPARAAAPPARLADGLALEGFDAVSYFLEREPRPRSGRAAFEVDWRGRAWRFASAANRDAFRGDPEVYAPRLGAFDPAGVLDGRLVDTDPLVFAVLAGPAGERLYLFRNDVNRSRMVADMSLVLEAEALWPKLAGLTDGDPMRR